MAGFTTKAKEDAYAQVINEGGTKKDARAARREVGEFYSGLMFELDFRGNRDVELGNALARLVQFLDESRRGIVHTDGESFDAPTMGGSSH